MINGDASLSHPFILSKYTWYTMNTLDIIVNIEDDTYPRYIQVQSNKIGRTKTITIPAAFCDLIGIEKHDTLKISLQDGSKLLLERMQ